MNFRFLKSAVGGLQLFPTMAARVWSFASALVRPCASAVLAPTRARMVQLAVGRPVILSAASPAYLPLASRFGGAAAVVAAGNLCLPRAMSMAAAGGAGRGFSPAALFAVAEIGGKQYKVTVDDSIVTESMVGRRVGECKQGEKQGHERRDCEGARGRAARRADMAVNVTGETVVLDKVMLLGDKGNTTVGQVCRVGKLLQSAMVLMTSPHSRTWPVPR